MSEPSTPFRYPDEPDFDAEGAIEEARKRLQDEAMNKVFGGLEPGHIDAKEILARATAALWIARRPLCHGRSISGLAREVGLSPSTLSRAIHRLSAAFGMSRTSKATPLQRKMRCQSNEAA